MDNHHEEEAKKLLEELGLLKSSKSAIQARINELNMRQLDRLKLMFGRVDGKKQLFSEKTREGIRGNDFGSFAEAVVIIHSFLEMRNPR